MHSTKRHGVSVSVSRVLHTRQEPAEAVRRQRMHEELSVQ